MFSCCVCIITRFFSRLAGFFVLLSVLFCFACRSPTPFTHLPPVPHTSSHPPSSTPCIPPPTIQYSTQLHPPVHPCRHANPSSQPLVFVHPSILSFAFTLQHASTLRSASIPSFYPLICRHPPTHTSPHLHPPSQLHLYSSSYACCCAHPIGPSSHLRSHPTTRVAPLGSSSVPERCDWLSSASMKLSVTV